MLVHHTNLANCSSARVSKHQQHNQPSQIYDRYNTASAADTAKSFFVETTSTVASDNIMNFKLRYTKLSYLK